MLCRMGASSAISVRAIASCTKANAACALCSPGTPVLSFGTGCNLTCKFCQNWDICKARDFDRIQDVAAPEAIADAAVRSGCHSVAFTYNDPVIFPSTLSTWRRPVVNAD